MLALALTAWPPYARLARAETLTIRNADFIAAARLQGAGRLRLLIRHIWPLCLSSLIVRVRWTWLGSSCRRRAWAFWASAHSRRCPNGVR